jgi:D-alanyl-D-alanine dipeptidase
LLLTPSRNRHTNSTFGPTGGAVSLAAMNSDRFDAAVYARRLAAAAAATAEAGLTGLVITPGYDLRYLTGSRAQTF